MPQTIKTTERTPLSRVYRMMISIKTSLVFLGVFAFLFFVGTVFPQSSDADRLERYREAGGKLVGLVGALDLLNLFHTWYFTLLTALFGLHLLLCSIHRLNALRRRPKFRLFTREELLGRDHSFSVLCPSEEKGEEIEKILGELGFRRLRYYSEDAHVKRVVVERGLPFRWLSWAYHICILLSIIGFCLTYLFAFEDYLTLTPGQRKSVALSSPTTNWRKLSEMAGIHQLREPRTIKLELEDFRTEYVQSPTLRYPAGSMRRMLAPWGLGGEPVRYELAEGSLFPRDWFSALRVYEDGEPVKAKRIQVNDPLRYAGLTFYQIGYDYRFDLKVGDQTLEDLQVDKPFTIPLVEGEMRLRTPRMGTLFGYDGKISVLAPTARLQYRPPAGEEQSRWTTAATLSLGQPKQVMHTEITLADVRESSILSYRYDPGVPLLWAATVALMALMALRIYLPWYQVRCYAEASNGRTIVAVSIRMVGLFARPERVKEKLCRALQR